MNWVKINTALPRSPKVMLLASLMGVSRHEALGLAVDWLCWLDSVTTDGSTGLTADLIDMLFHPESVSQNFVTDVTACHKMSQTLVTIGWLEAGENGQLHAVDFEKHNGDSAKKRAEAAERQRKSRARRSSQENVTEVTKKCDQIREDKSIIKKGSKEPKKSVTKRDTDPTRLDKKHPLPETSDDVLRFLAAQPNCGLKGDELLTCAESFFNEFDAVGWTLRGQPIQNWHSAARSYLTRWQNNLANHAAAAPRGGHITYRSQTDQNYEL